MIMLKTVADVYP